MGTGGGGGPGGGGGGPDPTEGPDGKPLSSFATGPWNSKCREHSQLFFPSVPAPTGPYMCPRYMGFFTVALDAMINAPNPHPTQLHFSSSKHRVLKILLCQQHLRLTKPKTDFTPACSSCTTAPPLL